MAPQASSDQQPNDAIVDNVLECVLKGLLNIIAGVASKSSAHQRGHAPDLVGEPHDHPEDAPLAYSVVTIVAILPPTQFQTLVHYFAEIPTATQCLASSSSR